MTVSSPRAGREPLKGRHVLFALVGFFGVCAAVDGFMIYRALSTFGGVDNPNAYRDGLAYNERIARDAVQAQSGWQDRIEVAADPQRVRVSLVDRDGSPVAGLNPRATFARPATNRFDTVVTLSEAAPGTYEAAIPDLAAGTWIVSIAAAHPGARADALLYQARRRVWLKR